MIASLNQFDGCDKFGSLVKRIECTGSEGAIGPIGEVASQARSLDGKSICEYFYALNRISDEFGVRSPRLEEMAHLFRVLSLPLQMTVLVVSR